MIKHILFASTMIIASPAFAEDYTICTGVENGSYHVAGSMIQRSLLRQGISSKVVIDTGGSTANAEKAMSGECDLFIAQPDAMVAFARSEPVAKSRIMTVANLHDEYLILLVNRDGKVKKLSHLESHGKDAVISVGDPDSSGAAASWSNLVAEDDDYKDVKISVEHDDTELALQALADKEIDAILMVTGVNANRTLTEATEAYSDYITIGKINDGDMAEAKNIAGKKMFESSDVPKVEGVTKKLIGFWNVSTYKMQAQLYANKDKFDKKTLKKVIRAARKASKTIKSNLN